MDIQEYFGGIDIYLFDQIQKGRIKQGMKILDLGCGNGRNLIYFMRSGYDVYGVDTSQTFINNVRFLTKQLCPEIPDNNFRLESLDKLSFDKAYFDVVVSSAVFHFAENDEQFLKWLKESWRVLKPNGMLFARLASTIGIENKVEKIDGNRYKLPDTSERYLVDEKMLESLTKQLNGELLEPIKTTNVQNMRCMTTWVLRKCERNENNNDPLNSSGKLTLYRE